ncbi:TMV resistance protein N-like [Melia azedarach]|uniref:TMV resistance protein N-like n=1 Tax=Melia azedarach TaxID=155640 RepID=A0ACC1YEH0_MELAZ|nr:TMV resistance protein N-like [Melia azedarach]
MACTVEKTFFEKELNSRRYFRVVIPGSKIPKWFRYQNEGSSITIAKPPDSFYNKNKLVGYVICSIFHVNRHPAKVRSPCSYRKHELVCCLKYGKMEFSSFYYYLWFREELVQGVSDHLWLFYLSNQQLSRSHWQFESNDIELAFQPNCYSCPEVEVKRCGSIRFMLVKLKS